MAMTLVNTLVEVEVSPEELAQLIDSWRELAKARNLKLVTEDLPNGQVRVAMVAD